MSIKGKISKVIFKNDYNYIYIDLEADEVSIHKEMQLTGINACASLPGCALVEVSAGVPGVLPAYALLKELQKGPTKAKVGQEVLIGPCSLRKGMTPLEQLQTKAADLVRNLAEHGTEITFAKAMDITCQFNPELYNKYRIESRSR